VLSAEHASRGFVRRGLLAFACVGLHAYERVGAGFSLGFFLRFCGLNKVVLW
jgi:hypothetical protein